MPIKKRSQASYAAAARLACLFVMLLQRVLLLAHVVGRASCICVPYDIRIVAEQRY